MMMTTTATAQDDVTSTGSPRIDSWASRFRLAEHSILRYHNIVS
ncbi:hypothetical protein X777_06403 [Ooceraea biroi]|uniref:Uncharacterized protein n=1 Tax=Ooceraea biroi TaxID=2015173 RepID=A0A026WE66_OOCBI|nr:hypothetical protein X777_06403 [Ooceraea biroi]